MSRHLGKLLKKVADYTFPWATAVKDSRLYISRSWHLSLKRNLRKEGERFPSNDLNIL